MRRALYHAWSVFKHCWQYRDAPRITVEVKAEYPITDAERLDYEWRFLQADERLTAEGNDDRA